MTRRQVFTLLSLPVLVSGVALSSVRFTDAAPSAGSGACVPVPGCCAAGAAVCAPATPGEAAVTTEAPAMPMTAPASAGDPCAGQPVCCVPGC